MEEDPADPSNSTTVVASSGGLSCLNEVTEIVPGFLWIGGVGGSQDKTRLQQLNIGYIVNATDDCPSKYPNDFEYLRIRLKDTQEQNLDRHFEAVFDFILNVKANYEESGKGVLVHCLAGISRSVSLVLAYLVKCEGFSLQRAWLHVKACRPRANPNAGFWTQLITLERTLRGKRGVSMRLVHDTRDTAHVEVIEGKADVRPSRRSASHGDDGREDGDNDADGSGDDEADGDSKLRKKKRKKKKSKKRKGTLRLKNTTKDKQSKKDHATDDWRHKTTWKKHDRFAW